MKRLMDLKRARAMAVAAMGCLALAATAAEKVADRGADRVDPSERSATFERFEKFVATAQITETLDFNVDSSCQAASPGTESTAMGRISGTGLGTTGLGVFTVTSLDCVRAASPTFQPPFTFSSRVLKLTMLGGDEIVATYSGTATLDPVTLLLVLNGSFEFTSGTGRFKKVKGFGTLAGAEEVISAPTVAGFVTFTGSISR